MVRLVMDLEPLVVLGNQAMVSMLIIVVDDQVWQGDGI